MQRLSLLLVEDSEDDALLVMHAFRRAGHDPLFERVDTEEAMVRALGDREWSAVLSDWSMPSFDAMSALRVTQAAGRDVPFIIISGTLGDENAVLAMRLGAHDFVPKDRLSRVVPAVEREVREAELRAEQRQTVARLRSSEAALAKAEKLRALGQMAAGVSHDLGNVLNPLSLYIQFAERALEHGDKAAAAEALGNLRAVVRRGVETLDRFRNYGQQEPEAPTQRVDLDRIAREAYQLARARVASAGARFVQISLQLGAPPQIDASPIDVLNALVNLLFNAVDAVGSGGSVVVLRTGIHDRRPFAEVEDDGPGMPPDVQGRVFEPYFTTKGADGTGLGLAMVFACMKRHEGEVELETALGRGARFRLWFPPAA